MKLATLLFAVLFSYALQAQSDQDSIRAPQAYIVRTLYCEVPDSLADDREAKSHLVWLAEERKLVCQGAQEDLVPLIAKPAKEEALREMIDACLRNEYEKLKDPNTFITSIEILHSTEKLFVLELNFYAPGAKRTDILVASSYED